MTALTCVAVVMALFLLYRCQHWKLLYFNALEREKGQSELREILRQTSSEALEKSHDSLYALTQRELEKKQKDIDGLIQQIHIHINSLERERKIDHTTFQEQVKKLIQTEGDLKLETSKLALALRTPSVKGRWGEIQLRRIMELAGMIPHCDFLQQCYDESSHRRPDVIVQLPGGRQIIVDAKVPLKAYLESLDAVDETVRLNLMRQHTHHIKENITDLSKKQYWEFFQPTPEFVVLFLPSEAIFSAALESDPTLIEYGTEQGVLIVTPTTLIALLKSIAYGWKQEKIARCSHEIAELGRILYKRGAELSIQWTKMGKGLKKVMDLYDKTTNYLEEDIFTTTRKLAELGCDSPISSIKKKSETTDREITEPSHPKEKESKEEIETGLPVPSQCIPEASNDRTK